jgi:prepilin-type N-terminal cleavage/methylation domain-containing protein
MQAGREFMNEKGYTILELIFTMSIAAVLSGIAVGGYRELNDPLQNGTNQIVSQMKHARVKAISNTTVYRVAPDGSNQIRFYHGNTCADTDTEENELTINLPAGVILGDTGWEICFNQRGLANQSLEIEVLEDSRIKTIEVLVGGSIRIMP